MRRITLVPVISVAVAGVCWDAAAGGGAPSVPRPQPELRQAPPRMPAVPLTTVAPYRVTMPMDLVRIHDPNGINGGELPRMPGSKSPITSTNAHVRDYTSSMPIFNHGTLPSPPALSPGQNPFYVQPAPRSGGK